MTALYLEMTIILLRSPMIVAGFFFFLILLLSNRLTSMQKSSDAYYSMFIRFYSETGQVLATLKRISDEWKGPLKVKKSILSAVGYLQTSAIADYQTAFSFIEKQLDTKNVHEIHEACLKEEYKKKLFLLTVKE